MAKQTIEEIISDKFNQFVSDKNLMKVLEFYINKKVDTLLTKDELEKVIVSCLENSQTIIDVSKLFVCSYNDDKVGFFYRDSLVDSSSLENPIIYDIYNGFESDYTAIRKNMYHLNKPGTYDIVDYDVNSIMNFDGKNYVANSMIINCLGSFEEIREMMRLSNNIIKPYKIGLSSREEMSQVLDFAINRLLIKNSTKKKP